MGRKWDEMTLVHAAQKRRMALLLSIRTAMGNNSIPLGKYRHFKGKEYEVIGIARHSETLEEMVVYRQLYGERELWVRPREMFCEEVDVEGKKVPRFQYKGE
jgi:hypothetical protein